VELFSTLDGQKEKGLMSAINVIVAPDSFKGSLRSTEAARAIKEGILAAAERRGVEAHIRTVPMADGGEGTVDAILSAFGGRRLSLKVMDPLGRKIDSFFGLLADQDRTAVIELAAASGLNLIRAEERNPLLTTTYGTGELIRAALDEGSRKIIIGIGGSATSDGGAGMAQALGARLLDSGGQEIRLGGGALGRLARIDLTGLDPGIKLARVIVASDVRNVLYGPDGAAAVYGPQKGASPEMVATLDRNLKHFADVVEHDLGIKVADLPGAGAAGGAGAGLVALLGAELQSGIDIIMDLAQLDAMLPDADLLITGEGATDFQTAYGKVPFGLAQAAKPYGVPVFCISGSLGKEYQTLYDHGITAFFSIINRPMTLEEAMQHASALLTAAAENACGAFLARKYAKK
jgi:glycerate kinase